MFLLNNIKVSQHDQRTIGDVQYPAGWFSNAEARAKVGMTEVPDIPRPDDNLYTSVENPDGSWTATARTAADIAARFATVRTDFINRVKSEAGALTTQVLSGLASEYELTEREAIAYKAAGYPAATATVPLPNSIQDEISSKAARGVTITATVACDAILTAATGWRSAQASLRTNRIIVVSKAEVAVDATALDLIKAEWVTFLVSLKATLGVA